MEPFLFVLLAFWKIACNFASLFFQGALVIFLALVALVFALLVVEGVGVIFFGRAKRR